MTRGATASFSSNKIGGPDCVTLPDNDADPGVGPTEDIMRGIRLVIAAGLALAGSGMAGASDYPAKPIRFLVPTSPGGTIDISARMLAAPLEKVLGQRVLVENRPGATYMIATNLCANAAPDGYTMCQININTHSFNPYQFKSMMYDPEKDLRPVYFQLSAIQTFAASTKSLPLGSVAEVRDHALKNPGKLNLATLGSGSSADLFRIWLNKHWGTDIEGVGYGGGVATALQSGEAQMSIVAVGTLAAAARSGAVRLLTVAAKERIPQFPDVPTFHEVGLGAYPSSFWLGIAVPSATPDAVVRRLNEAFVEAAKDPKYQEYLYNNAMQAGPTSVEGFARFLVEDRKAAEAIVKLTGVQPK